MLVAGAGVAALLVGLVVWAQEPGSSGARPEDKAAKLKEDLAIQQQNLARRFSEFQQQLLRLQQRLEKSPRKEDQDKAVVLKKALERAQDTLISTQFDSLVEFLKGQKFTKAGDIKAAHERTLKLADDLREVLALLNENSRALQLREERLRLEELLKRLERVIHDQKVARTINEINKDPKAAKSAQVQVTKNTQKLHKDFPGKDGKGGEAKPSRGEAKDAGKGEGKKGEGKNAGKAGDAKRGEGKDAGKSDAKKGEAKGDPKSGAGKAGDAKAGKGGEAKAGDSKSGKGGDAKAGDAKSGKSGEGKPGGAKSGGPGDEKKAGGAKEGPKIRSKAEDEKKQGEAKAGKGDGKQADAKSSKGGESKAGDSKSGGQPKEGGAKSSKSSGQGQSKGNGSPSPQQNQSPPGASKKGDNDSKDPPNQGNQGNQPQDDTAQAKKRIREANYDQQRAENKIDQGDKPGSKKDQDDAVKKLEDAKKKLEDLLRQLREEELERLLANLQARCEKMLAMQINVQDGTIRVAKEIDKTPEKKATRDQQQDSLKLSDKEKDIVTEATKAIEMLEAEGSAVAFPEVFQQVREDMKNVQRRLGVVDAGKVTQGTEQDIIDTLKEMIEALKKAQKELNDKKSPPPNSNSGPPPDQKLLDQIAELKMIRSMQIRVNNRTQLYGREYEGEQAAAPAVRQELRQLSERQERIFEVTNRIAKGDNR
jgi:hypothetical protein